MGKAGQWREALPPASEWLTIPEWARAVDRSESLVRGWLRKGRVPADAIQQFDRPAGMPGRPSQVTMVRVGTPAGGRRNRKRSRPAPTKKTTQRKSPLSFFRDAPDQARDRADFVLRLVRVTNRLVEYPGDLQATKWLLRALAGHHTPKALAPLLGLSEKRFKRLVVTGRTCSAVDDLALQLAYKLLAHLRRPVDVETIEHFAEAQRP